MDETRDLSMHITEDTQTISQQTMRQCPLYQNMKAAERLNTCTEILGLRQVDPADMPLIPDLCHIAWVQCEEHRSETGFQSTCVEIFTHFFEVLCAFVLVFEEKASICCCCCAPATASAAAAADY